MPRVSFFFALIFVSYSQGIAFDKAMIDSLSAPRYFGRGFEFNGHTKSAKYISTVFAENGLEPFSDSYFQNFSFETTIFESLPDLVINGDSLLCGKDYLPHASTASGRAEIGKLEIIDLANSVHIPNSKLIWNQSEIASKLVVIDAIAEAEKGHNARFYSLQARLYFLKIFKAKAVIIRSEHLVYSKPAYQAGLPVFVLKNELVSEVKNVSFGIDIERKRISTSNIVAVLQETAKNDSIVLLTGHYDHLGSIGKNVIFHGANDNASGIAMITSLATKLRSSRYKIVVIAFTAEESGLLGSKYFVENPLFDLRKVKFMLNLDMVASGQNALMFVGGEENKTEYSKIKSLAKELKLEVGKRKNAPISDQYFFLEKGVRGFFVYTKNGKQPYHAERDIAETLNWDVYAETKQLLLRFLKNL